MKDIPLRKGLTLCAIGVFPLGAAGCVRSTYMGVALEAGLQSEIQVLAYRARAGSKEAQFELGMRFEAGDGVPQNRARAIRLFKQAAKDSGGAVWIYVPSPGNGAPSRVIPVDTGSRQMGLREARKKLETVDQRQKKK